MKKYISLSLQKTLVMEAKAFTLQATPNPSFAIQYSGEKVVLSPEEIRTLNHTASSLNQKMLLGAGSMVCAYNMVE